MTNPGRVEWAGVRFWPVQPRDFRCFREPGLFGFVRRDPERGPLLLFVDQTELIARDAGPMHPAWVEALGLGMTELHVSFPVPVRIDRLQLVSRIVRRAEPILNVLQAAHPPAQPPAVQARLRGAFREHTRSA